MKRSSLLAYLRMSSVDRLQYAQMIDDDAGPAPSRFNYYIYSM